MRVENSQDGRRLITTAILPDKTQPRKKYVMKKMMRKNPGKIGLRQSTNRSSHGLIVDHGGTVLTFRATLIDGGRSLKITPGDKMDWKERTIKIDGKFPVEMLCPSVEGTVIVCLLTSGENYLCDTLTGRHLTDEEIKLQTKQGKIHLYS